MNQHCGKHDKIFDPDAGQTCPGCDTEAQQAEVKGPDDTIHELRRGESPEEHEKHSKKKVGGDEG